MRPHYMRAVFFGVLILTTASVAAESEQPVRKRKSHLGFGLGITHTASQLADVFGQGTDASILVNQHLYKGFGARLIIGAVYLGAPEEPAKLETYLTGLEFFGSSFRNFSMSFEYIAIGPSFIYQFGERHSLSASVALSLCSVKLEVAAVSAHRFKVSNGQWGYSGGVMYGFWIGDSWGLHTRIELNRIHTTTEADDLYYAFVRGDTDPLLVSWLVGVQVGYR
jgi:hypothetical protein